MNIKNNKPGLFEKSEYNIWTEPYIRQQMLKAHLDPESDGATRKHESVIKIASFIEEHTKPGSNLLDLGCGPGLYASLLKDKGYKVTGIDFNLSSVEYAMEQRKDIKYLYGDYIKDFPHGQYDVVILIYCDLGTHPDDERDILLQNIFNSLKPGGVFIFDIFTEQITKDKSEGKNWEYSRSGGFWNENEYLLISQTYHFPENRAFASQYNLVTEGEYKHFIVWERYYSDDEIKEILKNTGFNEVNNYNNISGSNNFTSNNEMFIIARKDM